MNSYTDDKSIRKYLSMIIHTIKFHTFSMKAGDLEKSVV